VSTWAVSKLAWPPCGRPNAGPAPLVTYAYDAVDADEYEVITGD
jgi:hypothetical protein